VHFTDNCIILVTLCIQHVQKKFCIFHSSLESGYKQENVLSLYLKQDNLMEIFLAALNFKIQLCTFTLSTDYFCLRKDHTNAQYAQLNKILVINLKHS
jgi:hypothetical protein